MDFMKCEWSGDSCFVTISVKDYPEHGATLEDLKPLIHEIRENANDMDIHADLTGVSLLGIERLKMIANICYDVIGYTKNDNILRTLEVQGAGPVFKYLYNLIMPRYFREIVVFL